MMPITEDDLKAGVTARLANALRRRFGGSARAPQLWHALRVGAHPGADGVTYYVVTHGHGAEAFSLGHAPADEIDDLLDTVMLKLELMYG